VNSPYNRDSSLHDLQDDLDEPIGNDREISLGTTTILGIFFALALICAVFFGFGYTMGRRSAQPPAGSAEPVASTSSTTSKPSPGSLASTSASSPDKDGDGAVTTVALPTSTPTEIASTTAPDLRPESQPTQPEKPANKPAPVVRVAPAAAASPGPTTAGTSSALVQVAAVSHQEDADILVSELKKRGYTVVIRQEPQDKLLHVQLGPFPTKKDADAMRQRLLADGYNAIVK
jgi:DedD protein